MNDRPVYAKWKRKVGGHKVCPRCRHRHNPAMKIEGRAVRPKVCVKCGAELPSRLTYPRKGVVRWYVRRFDPVTGHTQDIACRSSEHADDLIRTMQRDYTPDPIQEKLIEYASTLIRQVQADDDEGAINELIVKLGGDPVSRTLKQIGLAEAIDRACSELHHKDMRTDRYILDVHRVAEDFIAITDIRAWREVDPEVVKKFARILATGDWERDGRRVKAVGACTIKRNLAVIRSFVSRAVQNNWIHPRILDDANASIWSQAVEGVEHDYMPDADFQALIEAAGDDRWMRTLLLVAYNTAARRGDLLRLKWRDVDLDGTSEESGRIGPTVKIANTKSNRRQRHKWALFVPLYDPTVEALNDLRSNPAALLHTHTPLADRKLQVDDNGRAAGDEHVFPFRGYACPETVVSKQFGELCKRAGLVDATGKNRWTLHDLRRKANQDIQRAGGSLREQMALTGHKSVQVNVLHYQSADPDRMRQLVGSMSGFKGLRLIRESA